MKKKLMFWFLFLLFFSFGYIYFTNNINYLLEKTWFIQNVKKSKIFSLINNNEQKSVTWTKIVENTEKSEEQTVEEKVDFLRKKIKVKWLIESWNSFLENQYYLYALKEYLKASSESPKDKSIVNKIAVTYFSMKNFARSYWYYRQISDYDKLNKDDAMLTYEFLKYKLC